MVGVIVGEYNSATNAKSTEPKNHLKERGLTGEEGLDKIISAFVRKSTFGNDAVFKPVSGVVRREVESKQKAYVAPIRSFLEHSHSALDHESVEFEYAFMDVVDAYAREDLSLKYGVLDRSLFSLGQMVDTGDAKIPSIRIPLFFDLPYNDLSGRCTHEITDNKDRYEVKKFSFTSKAPFIPLAAKNAANLFLRDYYKIMDKLLQEPVVGSTLSQRLLSGAQTFAPSLHVRWIPSDYELNIETRVIDNDPLLTANLGKTTYLLHQWVVDAERPFQQYLDEFMLTKPK